MIIMKKNLLLISAILSVTMMMISCGGNESSTNEKATKEEPKEAVVSEGLSKGIGPITSVTLDAEIDMELAAKGEEIFKTKCSACHKVDKKFIGPSPKGVLERRSPEWIMNMILNPTEMVANDPTAKKLLMEFNGAPMANQNLTEEEARDVLEYFRTI
ncbi:MAG: cytochrome c [Arcticibacterium sp.]|jgi:cytochrome c